jgi:hypothetical protein
MTPFTPPAARSGILVGFIAGKSNRLRLILNKQVLLFSSVEYRGA